MTGTATASYDDLGNVLSAVRTYTGTQAQTIEYDYHHDGSRSDMQRLQQRLGNVHGPHLMTCAGTHHRPLARPVKRRPSPALEGAQPGHLLVVVLGHAGQHLFNGERIFGHLSISFRNRTGFTTACG